MENVRKHRDIKLATIETRRNYLVSEPKYYTAKLFSQNLLATEMRKTPMLMNKPVCLGLSKLNISKIVMHEFWHDFLKLKHAEKAKLCYMDTHTEKIKLAYIVLKKIIKNS